MPLRFLLDNHKSSNLLYLYSWLRMHTINNAGYIPEAILNSLSNHKRYVLIPKLRKLGWISGIKLTSVVKIIEFNHPNELSNNICVKLNYKHLKSNKSLKAFILASLEAYMLKGKYQSEVKGIYRIDRDTKKLYRQQIKRAEPFKTLRLNKNGKLSVKKSSTDTLTSSISHSMLAKWGFNKRSISRLRQMGINSYKRVFLESDGYSSNSFFSKKINNFITYLPTQVTCKLNYIYYINYNIYNNKANSSPESNFLNYCPL